MIVSFSTMQSQHVLTVFLDYALFTGGSTNGYCQLQIPVSTWINPNMTEDWDKGIIIITYFYTWIFMWIKQM